MLKIFSILILNSLFILNFSWANDPMEAYKQMLSNPGISEVQKSKIRKAMKKYQAFDKKMESKTTFKNAKEWYGHFKYTWDKKSGELQTLLENGQAKIRIKTDANYEVYEASGYQINKDFREKLLATKKFPESIKKLNNFDNPASPFPHTVEEMFLNHIHAKMVEAKRKSAKTDEEKMRAKIMEKMASESLKAHPLSSGDINYLIQEIKRYYQEREKREIKHLNANRMAKKETVKDFMTFAKSIKFTTPPASKSKFKINQDRDYLTAMAVIKCFPISEPLVYQNFKVLDQATLKRFKTKANVEIKEMNKLIKVVISSMDLDYASKNSKALRESIHSYKKRSVDTRSSDEFKKLDINSDSLYKDRDASKEKIKKWTEHFVQKANSKKLKASYVTSRNQYWYGNLAAYN
jgi:hypothetical protein